MYLDYSKLEFDLDGNPEVPQLALQTLAGETIGAIPGAYNIKMRIKFSEPSELEFDVASIVDESKNWIYDDITGYKQIYTKNYGIYLTMNPTLSSDGMSEQKHIKAYSIEKTLEAKKFFLEEGTFKFYDQTNPRSDATIIGRILEVASGWSVGYISPSLAQKYRTFEQYDEYLLSFIYNTAPEKYRCVFVFDPYKRTISAYDADEQRSILPIYLDFDNLIQSIDIDEISDELVTAIRPYGSDNLSIREVNPIGTNWIYDLSYFIANGDIPSDLGNKWVAWQKSILNNREHYRGLNALRASATAMLLSEKAHLVDLQGELDDLKNQQSVTIQALAMETTEAGKESQQTLLDKINKEIKEKESEISAQKAKITEIEASLDPDDPESYAGQISSIVNSLSISNYFTEEEYEILSSFFIEQDITENTFVATTVDPTISGESYDLLNENLSISSSNISKIELNDFEKSMYTLTAGTFSFSGNLLIRGDIIRGTLEVNNSGKYVLSIYAGSLSAKGKTVDSGMITASGTLTGLTDDIKDVTVDEVTTKEGTNLSFQCTSGSLFLTANISDYQKYSVQMELYEFAVNVLSDLATPTYEFSVDSGNFIFAQEFSPFRDSLKLGEGIYLNIGNNERITPYIIEFELDFENKENFSLVFSNRFKRHDNCNTLKDMIEQSYSSSRTFDAGKYIYNQAVGQTSMVSQFMNSSLEAAKNTILAAKNQSVVIDGAGIHVGGDSNYQLRIVDSMIAITDDNWEHAKLAIGLFASDEVGTYFGVNAEVIGGKLIVGNNLVIENETDSGVMQFKVDSSGAWLNNATMLFQKDSGGKILIDPEYGIVAGYDNLYSVDGTKITPSFVNSNGDIKFDSDGMPENANFYLDIKDGRAYFRGSVNASSGSIGGWTIGDDCLTSGSGTTFVALNASNTNNSEYAIWAGASSPSSAPFYVKRNGDIYAKNGTFRGTIRGGTYLDSSGNSMMNGSGQFTADYLSLYGLEITNGSTTTFKVTAGGAVTINGNITMSAGSSINWANVSEINESQSSAYSMANTAYDRADAAYSRADSAYSNADDAYNLAYENRLTDQNVFDVLTGGGTRFGIFSESTTNRLYINASYIRAGTIDADYVTLGNDDGGFCCARGSTGSSATYGAKMYGASGSNGSEYVFVSDSGAIMTAGGAYLLVSSAVHSSDEILIDSDERLKNNIKYDLEKYESLFLNLKPASFCLNHHHDNKRHLGLIAQEVEKSRILCGLQQDDLALLNARTRIVGDNDAEDYLSIGYGELIALNIHMVQKLYGEIDLLKKNLEAASERRANCEGKSNE